MNDPSFADVPYGVHAENLVDIWLPHVDRSGVVVCYIHGGGDAASGKEIDVTSPIYQEILAQGHVLMSAHYRTYPDAVHSAPAEDGQRLVQWMRHSAPDYGYDPERIVLMGRSFGTVVLSRAAWGDDVAVPGATDPVESESSRPAAVLGIQAMTSWNLLTDAFDGGHFGVVEIGQVSHEVKSECSALELVQAGFGDGANLPIPCLTWHQGPPGTVPYEDPHDSGFGVALKAALHAAGSLLSESIVTGGELDPVPIVRWIAHALGPK